jgi:hypothetical protein
MGRGAVAVVGIVLGALVACHRQPEPTYEYGETVTYTSTADDPAPQPVTPRASPLAAPVASQGAGTQPAASAAAEADDAVAVEDGEWVTTVDAPSLPPEAAAAGDDPSGASRSDEPPPEPAAPPAAAPPASDAEPVQPGRWYKAKRW